MPSADRLFCPLFHLKFVKNVLVILGSSFDLFSRIIFNRAIFSRNGFLFAFRRRKHWFYILWLFLFRLSLLNEIRYKWFGIISRPSSGSFP